MPVYPAYEGFRRVSLPGLRAGILTQPAFLVALSTSTENKLVQRGRFVREELLCQPLPELPIGAPPLPEDPDRPLGARLARHAADPACAACHARMDPLGVLFEIYDHTGRTRFDPPDAAGVLTGAGDADGPVADALELAARLAGSPVVEACLLRRAFEFYVGRAPTAEDAPALAEAERVQRERGDHVAALAALLAWRALPDAPEEGP